MDKALKAERKVLENVLEALKRWDPQDQARFKEWFGEATPIARAHVQEVFTRMLQQNRTYSSDNVRFESRRNRRAIRGSPGPVHDHGFAELLDKKLQGELSQAATFIHERSHFESIMSMPRITPQRETSPAPATWQPLTRDWRWKTRRATLSMQR